LRLQWLAAVQSANFSFYFSEDLRRLADEKRFGCVLCALCGEKQKLKGERGRKIPIKKARVGDDN
jgi:hypothetical protein